MPEQEAEDVRVETLPATVQDAAPPAAAVGWSVAQVDEQVKVYDAIQRAALDRLTENDTYQLDWMDKPALSKGGAEKLANFFGLACDFDVVEEKVERPKFDDAGNIVSKGRARFVFKVKLTRRGNLVATGIGDIDSDEKVFRERLYGTYTDKETGEVIEKNITIADLLNAMRKNGLKRAYTDALLRATGLSNLLSQDGEEMAAYGAQAVKRSGAKPGGKLKEAKAAPASSKQLDYLKKLFDDCQVPAEQQAWALGLTLEQISGPDGDQLWKDGWKKLSKKRASFLIGKLREAGNLEGIKPPVGAATTPRDEQPGNGNAGQPPDVPPPANEPHPPKASSGKDEGLPF